MKPEKKIIHKLIFLLYKILKKNNDLEILKFI